MADREYSNYQKKVIGRFYENRDQIDEQKLSELVTNLYLAETAKKRTKMWEQAEKIMTRLEVPESRIKHVIESDDAAILAAVVEDVQAGRIK